MFQLPFLSFLFAKHIAVLISHQDEGAFLWVLVPCALGNFNLSHLNVWLYKVLWQFRLSHTRTKFHSLNVNFVWNWRGTTRIRLFRLLPSHVNPRGQCLFLLFWQWLRAWSIFGRRRVDHSQRHMVQSFFLQLSKFFKLSSFLNTANFDV